MWNLQRTSEWRLVSAAHLAWKSCKCSLLAWKMIDSQTDTFASGTLVKCIVWDDHESAWKSQITMLITQRSWSTCCGKMPVARSASRVPRTSRRWTEGGRELNSGGNTSVLRIFFYQWLPAKWQNKREGWSFEHIYAIKKMCLCKCVRERELWTGSSKEERLFSLLVWRRHLRQEMNTNPEWISRLLMPTLCSSVPPKEDKNSGPKSGERSHCLLPTKSTVFYDRRLSIIKPHETGLNSAKAMDYVIIVGTKSIIHINLNKSWH